MKEAFKDFLKKFWEKSLGEVFPEEYPLKNFRRNSWRHSRFLEYLNEFPKEWWRDAQRNFLKKLQKEPLEEFPNTSPKKLSKNWKIATSLGGVLSKNSQMNFVWIVRRNIWMNFQINLRKESQRNPYLVLIWFNILQNSCWHECWLHWHKFPKWRSLWGANLLTRTESYFLH